MIGNMYSDRPLLDSNLFLFLNLGEFDVGLVKGSVRNSVCVRLKNSCLNSVQHSFLLLQFQISYRVVSVYQVYNQKTRGIQIY